MLGRLNLVRQLSCSLPALHGENLMIAYELACEPRGINPGPEGQQSCPLHHLHVNDGSILVKI